MRVCGKRATGLTLSDTLRRPIVDSTAPAGYSCPQSYQACNPEWLQEASTVEYVTCVKAALSLSKACPITHFAFTLDDLSLAQAALYTKA